MTLATDSVRPCVLVSGVYTTVDVQGTGGAQAQTPMCTSTNLRTGICARYRPFVENKEDMGHLFASTARRRRRSLCWAVSVVVHYAPYISSVRAIKLAGHVHVVAIDLRRSPCRWIRTSGQHSRLLNGLLCTRLRVSLPASLFCEKALQVCDLQFLLVSS